MIVVALVHNQTYFTPNLQTASKIATGFLQFLISVIQFLVTYKTKQDLCLRYRYPSNKVLKGLKATETKGCVYSQEPSLPFPQSSSIS